MMYVRMCSVMCYSTISTHDSVNNVRCTNFRHEKTVELLMLGILTYIELAGYQIV